MIPEIYDAELVRRVILAEAQRSSRPYIKTMTTALRCYLRFLSAHGVCRPWLDRAVPVIPQWRLSALPRYLPSADVERLIASCHRPPKPHGIRDKAILLSFGASRSASRRHSRNASRRRCVGRGNTSVRGKEGGRSGCRYRKTPVTLWSNTWNRAGHSSTMTGCSCDPRRPTGPSLVPCAISDVVRLALKRAGITDPPSRGANLLRHAAATGMSRAGASLDAIGTVLRHRSADTTAHYAKVDIAMLRQIAPGLAGRRVMLART